MTAQYLDKEAVLKIWDKILCFGDLKKRIERGEFDVPEMCCHRQNERDRLLKALSEKDIEIARLKDRIAQQDQELKDLGSELQDLRHQPDGTRCLCNICREEKGTGDGVYCKPVRVDIEKARLKLEQPVPSNTGMTKDIGDLTLRMDKLEIASTAHDQINRAHGKMIQDLQQKRLMDDSRGNTFEGQIDRLEDALKSLKEEVAAIPRPPKDRENYYEIDLGPGFEKIYISKNSVYPVLDQDSGGKKE